MPLRRAGTVPSTGARYGPGSAAHHAVKNGALRCVRGTALFDFNRFLIDACPETGEATLRPTGSRLLATLVLLIAPAAVDAQTIAGALPESAAALSRGEWPAYAGTYAAARYSPLTQIDRSNARN